MERPEHAARTGMSIARVKRYLNLFNASDLLLEFFENASVPLDTAVEFVRYERAAGEAAARRALDQHRAAPLGRRELEALRKRAEAKPVSRDAESQPQRSRSSGLAARVEAAFRRDPESTRAELIAVAAKLGLRLVESGVGGTGGSPAT